MYMPQYRWQTTLLTYTQPAGNQKFLLTNQATPWSRVLLGDPTTTQQVKKLSTFYGTQKFITIFATAYL
jgi:hypothetical protein